MYEAPRHGGQIASVERMFNIPDSDLPTFPPEALANIAGIQHEAAQNEASPIPVGMTYLGQFIAHDVTRLRRSSEIPSNDTVPTQNLEQLESPALDLRSLYGNRTGGDDDPVQYQKSGAFSATHVQGLRILDIPRDGDAPLIADARNDENLIISQLHAAFMSLHNYLVSAYADAADPFTAAQRELTLIYQRIIEGEFLSMLLHRGVYNALFGNNRISDEDTLLIPRSQEPQIHLEYIVAAFRFGHAMVRPRYPIRDGKILGIDELFELTGRGGGSARIVQENLAIDWSRFFDIDGERALGALSIGPFLISELQNMRNEATGNRSLAKRNLLRGRELRLPSGQQVVNSLQSTIYATVLPALDINLSRYMEQVTNRQKEGAQQLVIELASGSMLNSTPLWLYLLMERSYFPESNSATRLGPVASIIVGEQLRALITLSSTSIYDPAFDEAARGSLKLVKQGVFNWNKPRMANLLALIER
ncbi:MAG: peroxidase family protein [Pseudomonadota bacterium]